MKYDGFKPSLRHQAIYRGWAPPAGGHSLNLRLGFETRGIDPVIFHSSEASDCPLAQSRGLSYFKCLSLMKILKNTPKIYVGTYGVYNAGSHFGKWFDLSDYSDAQEFSKDCYEYHRNEFLSDGCRPELMFQDWEFIPDFLFSESSLHEESFKYFEAVSEMDQDRAEAFEIYCSNIISWPANGNDMNETLEEFNEAYQGYYGGAMKDPKTEFTYQYVEDTGMLAGVPEHLERYFDYEAFGRDLFLEGY